MTRVVFQGEPGSNSSIACLEVYPNYESVPLPTFEDCFAAVTAGEADLAMIPIENSLAGRVADIHHLLPASDLNIVGEFFLPIHFHVMAPKGAKLADIRFVHSHIHALGQCRRVIREHGWTPIVKGDTAGSAREIAQDGDLTAAALAPRLAAKLYGLDILKDNVEDETHNVTRFVVLSRDAPIPPNGESMITSLVFRVRNVPAALYKVMGGFATNGVNVTKLESYQLNGRFFATQFYADVEGHPEDRSVRLSLEELAFFSAEYRIVGVYPGSPFRKTPGQDSGN